MSALDFAVTGARPDPSALAPTLKVGLQITGAPDQEVQSILLRCQIRIEPERRRYDDAEQARLRDVFGEPQRWSQTLNPFLLTHVTMPVPRFTGATEIAMPVEVSYDLEVAVGKYLHALRDGEVPLVFLFSGTVFNHGPQGLSVDQIPWDREARYRLPIAVWTALIDGHFPGTGWLRLRRDTIDALQVYKADHGLATWDDVVNQLLDESAHRRHSAPLTHPPSKVLHDDDAPPRHAQPDSAEALR